MLERIICAGLGGQGVLTQGKIMMYAAYLKDLKVTWFPAYGNEMRGGNASCNVIISDQRIASPYADHPDLVMAMSESAVDLFEEAMASGGKLFVNSSLVSEDRTYRSDLMVIKAPVTEVAQKLNSERNANLCMLGKVIKETSLFDIDFFEQSMCGYFEEQGKGKYNAKNCEVLRAGYAL
ncbi:MAG: 2-oxoacid:acceptor oxidoreductase family protein [Lachnospiraceae bacterium]|nr:2-oxoacid:acceptor oxidoreductase family protein [Lachnospiraceae bacterium]